MIGSHRDNEQRNMNHFSAHAEYFSFAYNKGHTLLPFANGQHAFVN